MSEKETRFTPGPWRIADFIDETSHSIVAANHSIVAHMVGDIGHPRNDADARLVAATPDLYEAAKQGREAAAKLAEHYRHAYDSDREIKWCRVVDRCDAALSKALGETP